MECQGTEGTTVKPETEISKTMDGLRGRITTLRDTVSTLENKLECVMQPPSPGKEQATGEVKSPTSPLIAEISTATREIDTLNARLCGFLSRLEI